MGQVTPSVMELERDYTSVPDERELLCHSRHMAREDRDDAPRRSCAGVPVDSLHRPRLGATLLPSVTLKGALVILAQAVAVLGLIIALEIASRRGRATGGT